MQTGWVDRLLTDDPVVKSMLQGKSEAEINDIRKRLLNTRQAGTDKETVRNVIRYKQTLDRLRQDPRLKNKPEPYLMNDLRVYLPKNKNTVNEKDIDNAISALNVQRKLVGLAGKNLSVTEVQALAVKMKNRKVNTITINDVSKALANL